MSFLTVNDLAPESLERQIAQRLTERLRGALSEPPTNAASYNVEEINQVASLNIRLFPAATRLDFTLGEELRMLARFSAAELRSPSQITSHRPLIGPLIVSLKRLLWPLIRAQLKDAFLQIEEFNSRTLQLCARLIVQNDSLQHELRALRNISPSQPG